MKDHLNGITKSIQLICKEIESREMKITSKLMHLVAVVLPSQEDISCK